MKATTPAAVQAASVSTMKQEHDAQLVLLDALEAAICDDGRNASVYQLLQQLVAQTGWG